MASNFTQLEFSAALEVGIGEAGASPPHHSIISVYSPKEKTSGRLAATRSAFLWHYVAFFASAFFLQGGSTRLAYRHVSCGSSWGECLQ